MDNINQQLFNRVVRGLVKQGQGAVIQDPVDGGVSCQYNTADGLKCAAGMLISPHLYTSKLEGESVHNDVVKHAIKRSVKKKLLPNTFSMLFDLQRAHDNFASSSDFVRGFVTRANQIAKEYYLTLPKGALKYVQEQSA